MIFEGASKLIGGRCGRYDDGAASQRRGIRVIGQETNGSLERGKVWNPEEPSLSRGNHLIWGSLIIAAMSSWALV